MNSNIKAELVLASKNAKTNDVIYTFKLTYPRFILAEVNTHTIASKNTASSRAIPTKKQLLNVLRNPFIPHSIGWYKTGMVAGEEITGWRRKALEYIWSVSRYAMVFSSFLTWRLGASKQFSNRLVEPWMSVEQIWTSTDVENEILLRANPDAEPHYQELAKQKADIIRKVKSHFDDNVWSPDISNKCQVLDLGQWHLPFNRGQLDLDKISQTEELTADLVNRQAILIHKGKTYVFPSIDKSDRWYLNTIEKAMSTARCAWISYEMPGESKMNNIISSLLTYHKLILSHPQHLSPTQHVATPLPLSVRVGNLCGWLQHRKEIPNESGGDKVTISITPAHAQKLLESPEKKLKLYLR